MAEVVDFAQAKLEAGPHLAIQAVCLGCRKEWVAVAPTGTVDLECPACGLMKGVGKGLIGGEPDDLVFRCVCGNEAMTATIKPRGATRLLCLMCGTDCLQAVMEGWKP